MASKKLPTHIINTHSFQKKTKKKKKKKNCIVSMLDTSTSLKRQKNNKKKYISQNFLVNNKLLPGGGSPSIGLHSCELAKKKSNILAAKRGAKNLCLCLCLFFVCYFCWNKSDEHGYDAIFFFFFFFCFFLKRMGINYVRG